MHAPPPPRNTAQPASAGAVAALVGANLALAFGPWFVRLSDVGPIAAAFWRIALAAPILLALAFATGQRPRGLGRGLWIVLGVAGAAFAADLGSWHVGILRTKIANATLFGNAAILIFPVYGFLVARAWPSRQQGTALLLALVGAALLIGRSASLSRDNLVGDLFCLLAGLLYTIFLIVMARARETMPPLSALALSTIASSLPLLVAALALSERVWPADWLPLVALALGSQVIGQGLMIYALGRLSPLAIGIGLLVQPIVAGAIGWIAFGEHPGALDWIGAALVAAALVLVRGGERPRLAPAAAEVR